MSASTSYASSSSFYHYNRNTNNSSNHKSNNDHYNNTRYNHFHGPKQRVLGNWQAGNVPPAWRVTNGAQRVGGQGGQGAGGARRQQVVGSKIMLSQLPLDVDEKEVEELFKKTVGPLKDSFLIYNNKGNSKGMAVVVFQRPGDAVIAKEKYDGKFVDGRRPIRIEIVSDYPAIPTGPSTSQHAPPAPLSLFDRLGKNTAQSTTGIINHQLPRQAAAVASIVAAAAHPASQSHTVVTPRTHLNRRIKKGPKRLKKQNIQFPKFTNGNTGTGHFAKPAKTKEQLDQEMEEYSLGRS